VTVPSPENSLLEHNLNFLARRRPDLANLIRKLPEAAHLEIAWSRNRLPILIKNGISLHSQYDPSREGSKFAQSAGILDNETSDVHVVVFGLGLGYHLETLARQLPQLTVYEPDPAVIRAAFAWRDLTGLIPRITILTKGDPLPAGPPDRRILLVHQPTRRLESRMGAELEAWAAGRDALKIPESQPQRIMVVPPVNGGSLPVALHAAKALRQLGHHVVEADMTGLGPLYDRFRKADLPRERKHRVGRRMIEFCGEYVLCLAESENIHTLLALAQAPLDPTALNRLRAAGVKTAFWFVEDYRFLEYFRDLAPHYDYFFHIQGRDMEIELEKLGVENHAYLPPAADPDTFKPIRDDSALAPYRCDLSFMGAGYPNRKNVFADLVDYDFTIWGDGWELDTPIGRHVRDQGRRIPTKETPLIFNAAKINLNLHSSVFTRDLDPDGGFVNPRTFEVAACGAFQLVDNRDPLGRHFHINQEMAVFNTRKELREKIDYYLAHPEEREEIAGQARARVLAEHTYCRRMADMIARMSGSAKTRPCHAN
jgi:spore maturation protein CgeB